MVCKPFYFEVLLFINEGMEHSIATFCQAVTKFHLQYSCTWIQIFRLFFCHGLSCLHPISLTEAP